MVQLEEVSEPQRPPSTPACAPSPKPAPSKLGGPNLEVDQAEAPVPQAVTEDSGRSSATVDSDVQTARCSNPGGKESFCGDESSRAARQDDPRNCVLPSNTEDAEVFLDSMTEEDHRRSALAIAEGLKVEGNKAYGQRDFPRAMELYAKALEECPEHPDSVELRAACHSNRGICLLNMGEYEEAVKACSSALELRPGYLKALHRRAQAHEKLDKLEEALADVQKVLELDPGDAAARATVLRLQPVVEERREKLKEEMLGKLKELGNSVLGNFGLSLDNFKAVQDPNTGSYSISFQS